MTQNDEDLRSSLETMLRQHKNLIGIFVFSLGIGLRLVSLENSNQLLKFAGEIGSFFAASVAISFMYERFLQPAEQKLFMRDLKKSLEEVLDLKTKPEIQSIVETLEKKISTLDIASSINNTPKFCETGRISLESKRKFLEDARYEVIHVAIAASTLASYFMQRSEYDFKKPIEKLLSRGVNFKLLFLDPDSDIAKLYAEDRGEPRLTEKIRDSIQTFKSLRDEFKQAEYKGSFELFAYSHFPYYYALVVDPEYEQGKLSASNYMYALKRADNPVIEVHKSFNPVLFKTYYFKSIKRLLENSRRIQ